MAEDRGKEFQIGLAMSGAVSAGAYTAGVFDFLIQALDEWEKARKGPDAGKIQTTESDSRSCRAPPPARLLRRSALSPSPMRSKNQRVSTRRSRSLPTQKKQAKESNATCPGSMKYGWKSPDLSPRVMNKAISCRQAISMVLQI